MEKDGHQCDHHAHTLLDQIQSEIKKKYENEISNKVKSYLVAPKIRLGTNEYDDFGGTP